MKLAIGMLLTASLVQMLSATGVLEIKLLSFDNPSYKVKDGSCCDDLTPWATCKPHQCDPYIELCVDSHTPPSTNCLIGKSKTKSYDNTDKITFSAQDGSFIFHFQDWKGGVTVTVTAMEDDSNDNVWFGNTDPDPMETITFQVTSLAGINGRPNIAGTAINKGNIAKLAMEVLAYCDKYYYNDCTKYCKPDPVYYTCDNHGNKVCLPAWKGPHCNISIDDDCFLNVCSNGATCIDGKKSYTCICPPGYTGVICDVEILTTTSTPTTAPRSSDGSISTMQTTPIPLSTVENITISRSTMKTTPRPISHVDLTSTSISNVKTTSSSISTSKSTSNSIMTPSITKAITAADVSFHRNTATPTSDTIRGSSRRTTRGIFIPLSTNIVMSHVTFNGLRNTKEGFDYVLVAAVGGGGLVFLVALTCILCLVCKRYNKKGKVDMKPQQTIHIQVTTAADPAKTLAFQPGSRRHIKPRTNQVSPPKRKFKPTWVNKNEWQSW